MCGQKEIWLSYEALLQAASSHHHIRVSGNMTRQHVNACLSHAPFIVVTRQSSAPSCDDSAVAITTRTLDQSNSTPQQ